ncbi:MAG: hypothetical protein AAGE94_04915 [Acidobacteriota bacterium]
MPFIDIPTEQTTAVTDLVMGCVTAYLAFDVWRRRSPDPWKGKLWTATFAFLTVAAWLGAVAHGFQMADGTRTLLWHPLNLCLGLTVGLFAVGALHDHGGEALSRRVLPWAIASGVAFYGVTVLWSGTFFVFILYESVAIILALVFYARLARAGAAGALAMAVGVAITLIAAVVQATKVVRVTWIWEFDHNGVFHLIQIVGLFAFLIGLRRALAASGVGPESSD